MTWRWEGLSEVEVRALHARAARRRRTETLASKVRDCLFIAAGSAVVTYAMAWLYLHHV